MSLRTLVLRARVTPHAEAPFDRLLDPLTDDLLTRGPVASERFAGHWTDTAALTALAHRKRAPLDPALARALSSYHLRLGASSASLANIERLARGEVVAAVAGQQPSPLGGPLFSLHKIAGAIGLAAAVTQRTAIPCVPLFWMHAEDSDFTEIRGATVSDAELAVHDFSLPADAHSDGGIVGNISLVQVDTLTEQALAHWQGLPGHAGVVALWHSARSRARDLGEAVSALMMGIFAEQGLVVVDPRLPEFRAAARPIIDRYLANAESLQAAAVAAGARLEQMSQRRALSDASLDSFVFEIVDGHRRKIAAREARERGASAVLSPSVALRPAVQDGVFPTVAMACGPGEIAYLAQLREVFAGVGVEPALAAPRFGATWLPPQAIELLDASGCDPWALVATTDAVLAAHAETLVPPDVAETLRGAQSAAMSGLQRVAESSRSLDASLPQMVESARAKVDFQFARLHEGLIAKVRSGLDRAHPGWRRLRYVLLPGDKLQERRLASLEPIARRGPVVAAELVELATEHALRTSAGQHEHHLLEA
ncbi:MAG: bacillithiol biosynthesis BshC [Candidatus Eisenbacteria bacterium]